MKENPKKQYKVKLTEEMEGGVYSNAVSVHFNNNECIIDFGYSMPNMQEPVIKIVSRVNMSHRTAESFIKALSNALLDWRNKQKQEPSQ